MLGKQMVEGNKGRARKLTETRASPARVEILQFVQNDMGGIRLAKMLCLQGLRFFTSFRMTQGGIRLAKMLHLPGRRFFASLRMT